MVFTEANSGLNESATPEAVVPRRRDWLRPHIDSGLFALTALVLGGLSLFLLRQAWEFRTGDLTRVVVGFVAVCVVLPIVLNLRTEAAAKNPGVLKWMFWVAVVLFGFMTVAVIASLPGQAHTRAYRDGLDRISAQVGTDVRLVVPGELASVDGFTVREVRLLGDSVCNEKACRRLGRRVLDIQVTTADGVDARLFYAASMDGDLLDALPQNTLAIDDHWAFRPS